MTRDQTQGWRGSAACATVDPELHHPPGYTGVHAEQVQAARAVCAGCRVIGECWLWILGDELGKAVEYRHGVWAGLTPAERAAADPVAARKRGLGSVAVPLAPALSAVLSEPSDHRVRVILDSLSSRERQALTAVARGLSNPDIAVELGIEDATVKCYMGRIRAKLGLTDRAHLVAFAYETGLVTPGDTAAVATAQVAGA